jgi:hypothetical protein
MTSNRKDQSDGERGIALITALMISAILLALGMAVAMSATSDTITTKSQRVGEQAFFAADAGVAIARRALATAIEEEIKKIQTGQATYGDGGFYRVGKPKATGEFPDIQVLPDPIAEPNHPFYQNIYNRAEQLTGFDKRDERLDELNGTSFTVEFRPLTGKISLLTTPGDASKATETDLLRYTIEVTGRTQAGGRATIIESGRMYTTVLLTNASAPGQDRDFSFSGFGAFFDNGDTLANAALAGGTFSGVVHTNTHLAFNSNRSVTFRNVVSQVDNYIRYDSDDFSKGRRSIPTADMKGIDISSEGYKKVSRVPLPDNNYSQEYAVINATGITNKNLDGSPVDPPSKLPTKNGLPLPIFGLLGRVTPEALAVNLRDAWNKEPVVASGQLNAGTYISSADGNTITGAGIYVQGDATDVQLTTSGTDQIYIISQKVGTVSQTTTITVSPSKNQTTVQTGTKTKTFSGIPMDRFKAKTPQPAVSLFVNGGINSLRGGTNGSSRNPAIAADTRLTVTAQRDITITGDLKYANPVVNSDGTPVSNLSSVTNVLGIFTNDGNVNLAPNKNYVSSGLNLEMNAAVVAFNNSIFNDGSRIEGSITYTGSENPDNNDRWKLVGSRVQSKINDIRYANRDVFFDVRFSGGKFAPPFFPGTTYDLGEADVEGDVTIYKIESPTPTSVSWYRENN